MKYMLYYLVSTVLIMGWAMALFFNIGSGVHALLFIAAAIALYPLSDAIAEGQFNNSSN